MKIAIPDFCLVVLIDASGSGKSTFAAKHFLATETVSSDWARGLVDDDEASQTANDDAFDLVHFIVAKRLGRRRLTVVDATNLDSKSRAALRKIAKVHHASLIAIVLNPGDQVCQAQNTSRPDRLVSVEVVQAQSKALKRQIKEIDREGFKQVHVLASTEEINAFEIVRERLASDRRGEAGPFDIIGDVHGCADELMALLLKLGYEVKFSGQGEGRQAMTTAPKGRRVVFVGDLVDRGPNSPDVLRIVMAMVGAGQAFCVPGNHDVKLVRWLGGKNVQLRHGLAETAEQFGREPEIFRPIVQQFLVGLASHAWLAGGKLVVAHAGINEEMIGRSSEAVRDFCLYGERDGGKDAQGLPIRYHWAADYRGATEIVYGHTPVQQAEWVNNTLCIDTGCCFGGKLTALRWPEKEIVTVDAARIYYAPLRPFGHPPVRSEVA